MKYLLPFREKNPATKTTTSFPIPSPLRTEHRTKPERVIYELFFLKIKSLTHIDIDLR